jgi:DNA modification methylase
MKKHVKWVSEDGRVELYCGDAFDILHGMRSNCIDAIVTDPPYMLEGHMLRPKDKQLACDSLKGAWNENDPRDTYIHFKRICKESCNLAVFHDRKSEPPIPHFEGWNNHYLVKSQFSPRFRAGFCSAVEVCTIYKRPKVKLKWYGASNVKIPNYTVCGVDKATKHPAEKPITLINKLITCLTAKDDVVLDPFMGSGTTGVSCVSHGRKFIGVELDPKFFEMAKERIISSGAIGEGNSCGQPIIFGV